MRSTKAGDYPRLRRDSRRPGVLRRPARSTKAGDYPRLRLELHPGPVLDEHSRRSTKAGDYPRLRPPAASAVPKTGGHAQRRPEITPGYDPPSRSGKRLLHPPRSTKAGDYPRLRPRDGCDDLAAAGSRSTKAGDYPRLRRLGGVRTCRTRRALNEGRRLPPATTRSAWGHRGVSLRGRSTKAGDYPRLRQGAAERAAGGAAGRSTKAGDYPRLRLEHRLPHLPVDERSTKAGDYPRLRPASQAETG